MVTKSLALLPSVPLALKALDRLENEIANAPNFETLERIANRAAGLQREFQKVTHVAARAGTTWVKAVVRVGEELNELEPAKGTRGSFRGKPKGRGSSGGPIMELPDDSAPTLAEMGVNRKYAARAKRLAEIPEGKRQQYIVELIEAEKGVTPAAVLAKQRQENKAAKTHAVATAEFSADGPFDIVVIDPPWPMQKIDREVRPNQDAFDYPTMTPEELQAFWRDEMESRINPDCHLFVWTTQRFLPAALGFIEAVGFRYVLTFVWHKAGGFQPIGLPQYNCEFAIYARLGAPVFIDTKEFPCCFEAPRREHSRKPDVFYDMIRRVTGGSRIDVFSRETREGFAQYGNEVEKFNEVA